MATKFKNSEIEKEKEYLLLLDLLYQIIKESKGSPAGQDNRFLEAEALALKLVFHSASVLYLSRGTSIKNLPSSKIDFFDPASINVLARAILETFLTFHYIFVAPKTNQMKDFRYCVWQLGGLCERQKFPAWSLENKEKQREEKQIIEELRKCLGVNPLFRTLGKNKQKKLLNGKWRQKSWREIALDTGFDELHASLFYSYLCEYAHSGSLSTLQISQAKTKDIQKRLFRASMEVIMIAMANMIFSYCKIFPKGNKALEKKSQVASLARIWVNIGQQANALDK